MRSDFGRVDLPDINLMSDARWCRVLMQLPDAVADQSIGGGDPFPGSQVVQPRFHQKGLVQVLRIHGIAIDAPTYGSIAKTSST